MLLITCCDLTSRIPGRVKLESKIETKMGETQQNEIRKKKEIKGGHLSPFEACRKRDSRKSGGPSMLSPAAARFKNDHQIIFFYRVVYCPVLLCPVLSCRFVSCSVALFLRCLCGVPRLKDTPRYSFIHSLSLSFLSLLDCFLMWEWDIPKLCGSFEKCPCCWG